MSKFTCPIAYVGPPILPGPHPGNRLFKFYPNRAESIAVYHLSDGTFVQNLPGGFAPDGSAIANTNTNIPQPYNPNNTDGPFVTSYYTDYTQNPPKQVVVTTSHVPYIVKLYQETTVVTAAEVALLTAAGYGACIS